MVKCTSRYRCTKSSTLFILVTLLLCFLSFGSGASDSAETVSWNPTRSHIDNVLLDEGEDTPPEENPVDPSNPVLPYALHNLSLSIGTFSLGVGTNKLGAALCTALGAGQCMNYTYVSSSTTLVSTTEASVIPGIKTPQTVQKTLQLLQYELNVVNRTMGLAHLLNSVLYPSPLLTYNIQSVAVANLSTLYTRPDEPIFSYIGNTNQCLSHFWYLVFFVIAAPLLACGCHYYYLMGKESARESYALFSEQVALRAMGPSGVQSANASVVGGYTKGASGTFPADLTAPAPAGGNAQQFSVQQQSWGMSQSVSGMPQQSLSGVPQSVSGTFQAPQFSPQSPQAAY